MALRRLDRTANAVARNLMASHSQFRWSFFRKRRPIASLAWVNAVAGAGYHQYEKPFIGGIKGASWKNAADGGRYMLAK